MPNDIDPNDIGAPEAEIARLRARVRELEARHELPAHGQDAPSLQMVLEHSPDAIVVVDRELRLIYVNRTFTPRTVPELLNRSALEFLPPQYQQRTIDAMTRVLTTGTVQHVEVESASGHVWEARLAPIKRGDEIIAVLGIAADITQRKRLEELSQEAQKLEALGRLTAGIAHNFNNLLLVILTNLNQALPKAEASLEPSLAEARRAAQRAVELVRELLAFASGRRSEATMARTDLVELVSRTVAMSRASLAGITVEVTVDGEVVPAWADARRIEHVVLNVLLNARDALAGQLEPAPRIDVLLDSVNQEAGAGSPPRRAARIRVRDNGPGVPEELRSRVFEPFFTTKAPRSGTGLGLATAYGTMIDHGGTITCDSQPGAGATFTLLFPSAY